MNIQSHLGRSYIAINDLIDWVDPYLSDTLREIKLYDKSTIKKRLLQKINEIILNPFLRFSAGLMKSESTFSIEDMKVLKCGGLIIDIEKKRIRPSFTQIVRSLAEFLLFWSYILIQTIFSRPSGNNRTCCSATLLYGLGSENYQVNGSDKRFVAFCRNGQIRPLTNAKRTIVQSRNKFISCNSEHFQYERFPELALLRGQRLSLWLFVRFLREHILSAIVYIFCLFRNPIMCILARDFSYHGVISLLNFLQLIENVVITNSNYSQQFLWMTNLSGRTFRTHMVWYSMNNNGFVYADDPIVSIFPGFKHMRVDECWVWTEGQAKFLSNLGVRCTTRVVGPILWYLQQTEKHSADSYLRVTVFDVTPMGQSYEEKFGFAYNYYSSENLTRFIQDILATREVTENVAGKKVKVNLKHKRLYHSIHDSRYINYIQDINRRERDFEIVAPESNMYTLISQSELIIVIPYSSPAYVASHLGVPAIYYDPTRELLPTHEQNPLISFASGRDELIHTIHEILANKHKFEKSSSGASSATIQG